MSPKFFTLVAPQPQDNPDGILQFVDMKSYALRDPEKEVFFTPTRTKAHLLLYGLLFGDTFTISRFEKFCNYLKVPTTERKTDDELQTNYSALLTSTTLARNSWFQLQQKFLVEARTMRVAHALVAGENMSSSLSLTDVVVLLPAVDIFLGMHQKVTRSNTFKPDLTAVLFNKNKSDCYSLKLICEYILHAYTGNSEPVGQTSFSTASLLIPSFMPLFRKLLLSDKFAAIALKYYANPEFAMRMAFRLETVYAAFFGLSRRVAVDASTFKEVANKNWMTTLVDSNLKDVTTELSNEQKEAINKNVKLYFNQMVQNGVYVDLTLDSFQIGTGTLLEKAKTLLKKIANRSSGSINFRTDSIWCCSSKKIPQFVTFSISSDTRPQDFTFSTACFVYQAQCMFFATAGTTPLEIIFDSLQCVCVDADIAIFIKKMYSFQDDITSVISSDNKPFSDITYEVKKVNVSSLPWFVQRGAINSKEMLNSANEGRFNQITNAIEQDKLFHSTILNSV